jgi:serine/threonine-protein kinase
MDRTTAPKKVDPVLIAYAGGDIFDVGEVLGRVYEIRAVLGAGGMGQVFEAHDHALDRRVAIKAAWPQLPTPALRNEARALAAFRHPSLVTVHGLGVHRGIDYIVMERIYGVSLADEIDRRHRAGAPMEVAEVCEIVQWAAEGLAVVHRAGIAHRDVKPSNIMLTPDRRVVLMDFGLVLPEFSMAQQEYIAGSPPYMAPEALANVLAAGSGQLVDIYALGVTAFEMLAGRVPRDAQDLEKLWELCKSPPPDLREIRPDVPGALVALIEEMLERDPGARPQSAESVAWALGRIRDRKGSKPAARPLRVLVVEDDADVARVIAFYAKKALGNDVEIHTAYDGITALSALRTDSPDVMLLDLHMPRMNGIEVAMYMRGEGLAPACTIVSVSAGAQEHDRQLMHQLGIRHFVKKGEGFSDRIAEVLRDVRATLALSEP